MQNENATVKSLTAVDPVDVKGEVPEAFMELKDMIRCAKIQNFNLVDRVEQHKAYH